MHLGARTLVPIKDDILDTLERRLGRLHARQRLGIEKDHEAQVFGQGLNFFHIENLTLSHTILRAVLRLTGTYWRGASNAAKVELRHNRIASPNTKPGLQRLNIGPGAGRLPLFR